MLIEKKHFSAECLTGKNYYLLLVLAVVQRKVGYQYTNTCKDLMQRSVLLAVRFSILVSRWNIWITCFEDSRMQINLQQGAGIRRVILGNCKCIVFLKRILGVWRNWWLKTKEAMLLMVKLTWSNFLNLFPKYAKFHLFRCLSLNCVLIFLEYILCSNVSIVIWYFHYKINLCCLKYPYKHFINFNILKDLLFSTRLNYCFYMAINK